VPAEKLTEELDVFVNFFINGDNKIGNVHSSGASWYLRPFTRSQISSEFETDITWLDDKDGTPTILLFVCVMIPHKVVSVPLRKIDCTLR
jgi:hypothetical protein